MNCSIIIYTTHQFTCVIYYLVQDKFKYPKILKIQQVHQEIHAKQYILVGSCINNNLLIISLMHKRNIIFKLEYSLI